MKGFLPWLFGNTETPSNPVYPENVNFIRGPGEYKFDIVGESHYQAALEEICSPRKEDGEQKQVIAFITLEDSNPYDKFAVRIDIEGKTVGYMSKKIAQSFRRQVEHCFGCPKRKECPVKSVRNGYGFSYDKKQVKMARRRAREKTASFRDRYRFRAGIEATFSALDRLTGVKYLRVRGMPAGRFAVVLKALGLNLLRAAAARKPENGEGPAPFPVYPHVLDGIVSVHGKFVLWVRSAINYLGFGPVPAQFHAAKAG